MSSRRLTSRTSQSQLDMSRLPANLEDAKTCIKHLAYLRGFRPDAFIAADHAQPVIGHSGNPVDVE